MRYAAITERLAHTGGAKWAIHQRSREMEAAGADIIELTIGEPDLPPDPQLFEVCHQSMLAGRTGYSSGRGEPELLDAIAARYARRRAGIDQSNVLCFPGTQTALYATMMGLTGPGDGVLVGDPFYATYDGVISASGAHRQSVPLRAENGFRLSARDLEASITPASRILLLNSPHNPTGAVYSREVLTQIADLARKHELMLLADEIYDKILYDDAEHIAMASVAPDVLTLTFNGLSKAYRVAGYRSGWLVITGPKEHATSFIEGISLLANMRLCPNVPAQHAIQVALGGHQSIEDLVLPGGRLLEQRDVAWEKLNEIPGVSCVKPEGALYAFPRLDPEVYDVVDDEQLVLDLLLQEKILVTQGTGFNWPTPDHLRIVTLPWSRDLANAIERLGNFLVSYRQ